MKARADVGELAEEEPVARRGKRDARARHHRSVEGDEDAEGHCRGHKARSAGTGHDRKRRNRRPLAASDLRGREDVLNGGVGGHEEHAHDEQAADERDGQAAFRVAHFAGHHGEIVPSVVGPQGGDEGEHKSAKSAYRMRQTCGEVGKGAGSRGKAEARNDQNQDALENGEDKLKVAGLFDAEIIEPGHKPGDGDGEQLRPKQGQRAADSGNRASIRNEMQGRTRACAPSRW